MDEQQTKKCRRDRLAWFTISQDEMREGLKGGKGRSRPRYSNNNNNINTNTKKKDDKGGRDPQLGTWHLSIYLSIYLSNFLFVYLSI